MKSATLSGGDRIRKYDNPWGIIVEQNGHLVALLSMLMLSSFMFAVLLLAWVNVLHLVAFLQLAIRVDGNLYCAAPIASRIMACTIIPCLQTICCGCLVRWWMESTWSLKLECTNRHVLKWQRAKKILIHHIKLKCIRFSLWRQCFPVLDMDISELLPPSTATSTSSAATTTAMAYFAVTVAVIITVW